VWGPKSFFARSKRLQAAMKSRSARARLQNDPFASVVWGKEQRKQRGRSPSAPSEKGVGGGLEEDTSKDKRPLDTPTVGGTSAQHKHTAEHTCCDVSPHQRMISARGLGPEKERKGGDTGVRKVKRCGEPLRQASWAVPRSDRRQRTVPYQRNITSI
jgi:hypothetical protein